MDDSDTLAFGEEHLPEKRFRNPFVSLFHVLFRALSIIVYILCGFSSSGFIGSFVAIVLLISIDFWLVKNITGRLMVGLRWWNYIDEDGKSHWVFEARKGDRQGRVSSAEVRIFWGALVATPLIWAVLFLIALARVNFKWIMIVCIALTLSASNLYGYVRCKIGKSEGISGTIRNYATNIAQKQMVSNVTNYFSRAPPTTSPSTNI